jgi:hypothetical protein
VVVGLGAAAGLALDFVFYAAIPLAFAVANPSANALPAAALLASFIGSGSSFLAFAALAEKRGLTDTALPGKSFYFLGGLTEATETITVFAAMCIWSEHFAVLAYGFAGLCAITTGMRVWWGYRRFGISATLLSNAGFLTKSVCKAQERNDCP